MLVFSYNQGDLDICFLVSMKLWLLVTCCDALFVLVIVTEAKSEGSVRLFVSSHVQAFTQQDDHQGV